MTEMDGDSTKLLAPQVCHVCRCERFTTMYSKFIISVLTLSVVSSFKDPVSVWIPHSDIACLSFNTM